MLITSNATGTYSIRGLLPGSYTVQVVATTSATAPRTANVSVPTPT